MKRRFVATVLVAMAVAAPTVHAARTTVIEVSSSGVTGAIGLPTAQSFRPDVSGRITTVSVWAASPATGSVGELTLYSGDRPGVVLGRFPFAWTSGRVDIELTAPVVARAGEVYTLSVTGQRPAVVFGVQDPYPGGEVVLQTATGWRTWSEFNSCTGGLCLAYVVDQRVAITIVDDDADGDGVVDADDRCPETVLPESAVDRLRSHRFAATAEGFVDSKGRLVATLSDTAGCSATQIVGAMGLGYGHLWFGITRPHLDRWIEST